MISSYIKRCLKGFNLPVNVDDPAPEPSPKKMITDYAQATSAGGNSAGGTPVQKGGGGGGNNGKSKSVKSLEFLLLVKWILINLDPLATQLKRKLWKIRKWKRRTSSLLPLMNQPVIIWNRI